MIRRRAVRHGSDPRHHRYKASPRNGPPRQASTGCLVMAWQRRTARDTPERGRRRSARQQLARLACVDAVGSRQDCGTRDGAAYQVGECTALVSRRRSSQAPTRRAHIGSAGRSVASKEPVERQHSGRTSRVGDLGCFSQPSTRLRLPLTDTIHQWSDDGEASSRIAGDESRRRCCRRDGSGRRCWSSSSPAYRSGKSRCARHTRVPETALARSRRASSWRRTYRASPVRGRWR